ncbi:hypothetical protein HanPSC8_Chr17g0791881 [Helianthus annuus]|nr:hypothetical protein HanPSC8_Chr17g0791881 [Helianthus annuus]
MSIVIITFHSIQASLLFFDSQLFYIQTCDLQVRIPTLMIIDVYFIILTPLLYLARKIELFFSP